MTSFLQYITCHEVTSFGHEVKSFLTGVGHAEAKSFLTAGHEAKSFLTAGHACTKRQAGFLTAGHEA